MNEFSYLCGRAPYCPLGFASRIARGSLNADMNVSSLKTGPKKLKVVWRTAFQIDIKRFVKLNAVVSFFSAESTKAGISRGYMYF